MADRLVRVSDGELTAFGVKSGERWSFVRTKAAAKQEAEVQRLQEDPDLKDVLEDPVLREMVMEDVNLRRALLGDHVDNSG